MTTTSSAPARTRPPRGRDRVLLVVVVFLAVSAVASALLAAVQESTGLPADVLVLTQLATAFGAVATWLLWRGRLVLPPVRRRGLRAPLLASLAVAGVVAAVLVVAQTVWDAWPPLDPGALGAPLVVVLAAQLLGAAGEEVGWRGLVQPLLETRLPVLGAAVVTGLLFGLGHVHVLAAGPVVYALFLVSAVGLSVALAYVTTGRSVVQRVVLGTVLHWLVNVVLLVGFSGGDASVRWTASTAVATVVAGAGCALVAARAARRAAPTPA
ncbi:CPBP family intramembrane glutamic endopeptidase [Cellulomonas sp. JZ18]|uniref:CPBP family intramembrane glutamic endopeptidase n=1 Tax=Cellulomonas sp. JZ18 TaxID=2654191 RepID=UPI0018B01380|nr:CPBP family intramembrane glutamic endopeptidase [Cellulomonas sp. JZ18]